jgi:hypothetical protein
MMDGLDTRFDDLSRWFNKIFKGLMKGDRAHIERSVESRADETTDCSTDEVIEHLPAIALL